MRERPYYSFGLVKALEGAGAIQPGGTYRAWFRGRGLTYSDARERAYASLLRKHPDENPADWDPLSEPQV